MPDLFDNFFTSIGAKLNGGHTRRRYSAGSQVNTGSFYSYHNSPSNNNYWLPRKLSTAEDTKDKPEMNAAGNALDGTQPIKLGSTNFSATSNAAPLDDNIEPRSRLNSTSSEKSMEN
ncbi:hypothetical protein CANMA_001395 [Candida margitis]|uniref:uncharacterized protein n=1 Tax=Candida margitis TaxID=1775924 RepID=UPI0022263910|nr:uncharacterized protein CANMA_001395 [Candida margitis]KAI5969545.1 hypothetical protein CANMA_001395 [Candida margitis]